MKYITLIFTVTVQSLPILIWNDPNYITIRISVISEIRSSYHKINYELREWHELLYFELWGLNFELYDMYL